MRKRLQWIIGSAIAVFLVFVSFGWIWAIQWAENYLSRTHQIGLWTVSFENPRLHWNLALEVESVDLYGPGWDGSLHGIRGNLRFRRSALGDRPRLLLELDSASLVNTSKPGNGNSRSSDTLVFPQLKLPLEFAVEVRSLNLKRPSDSTQWSAKDVHLEAPSSRRVNVHFGRLSMTPTDLDFHGSLVLDWREEIVRLESKWGSKGDTLELEASAPRANLLETRYALRLEMDSLSRYFFRSDSGLLRTITGIRIYQAVDWDSSLAVACSLAFAGNLGDRFGRREIELYAEAAGDTGSFSARVEGKDGRLSVFAGNLFSDMPNNWRGLATWWPTMEAHFTGGLAGDSITIGRKRKWTLPIEGRIVEARADTGAMVARVETSDGSVVEGQLSYSPLTASFTAMISEKESWAFAWTQDHVQVREGRIVGKFEKGVLEMTSRMGASRAYGAEADSLAASHRVTGSSYELLQCSLYTGGDVWDVSGRVDWERIPGQRRHKVTLGFQADHPAYGGLLFAMPEAKVLEFHADKLWAASLPFTQVAPLAEFQPHLSGKLHWRLGERSGNADLQGAFAYLGHPVDARLKGLWNATRVTLNNLALEYQGNRFVLTGRVLKPGENIFQWKNARLDHLESIRLHTADFDVALLDRLLFAKAHKGITGRLDADLGYEQDAGFLGQSRLKSVSMEFSGIELIVPSLKLDGLGDSLVLEGRSTGEHDWLKNNIRISLSQLFENAPRAQVEISTDGNMLLHAEGRMEELRRFEGRVHLSGDMELREQGFSILESDINAKLVLPLNRDLLREMRLETDVFKTRIASPRFDSLRLEGQASLLEGTFALAPLAITTSDGNVLKGHITHSLSERKSLQGWFEAKEFTHRWSGGNRLRLRGVQVDLSSELGRPFKAEATTMSVLYRRHEGPLVLETELSNLSALYLKPTRDEAGSARPKLKLRADMDRFFFQHRIWSEAKLIWHRLMGRKEHRSGSQRELEPLELDIAVQTRANGHRIQTEVLRMDFNGEFAIKGVWPYVLATGELSGAEGELGLHGQYYRLQDFELTWNNRSLPEGDLLLTGRKNLARDCGQREEGDSCSVWISLEGQLNALNGNFSYQSDCGESENQSMAIATLMNSVRKGCYDPSMVGGGSREVQEALGGILLSSVNKNLSSKVKSMSGSWIETTNITGVGGLFDSAGAEALSLEVQSREFLGVRARGRSGYYLRGGKANPWEYAVGVEWEPPLEHFVEQDIWKLRLKDRVVVEAAAETEAPEEIEAQTSSELRKRVGLRYRFRFWKLW